MEPRPLPIARGVTLLEAVFGVVLLGLVTATLTGVSSAVMRATERQRELLGASELANRLMIIHVDDPREGLPPEGVPVDYGDRTYRWSIIERPVRLQSTEAYRRFRDGSRAPIPFERQLRAVTIDVWLSESNGGSFRYDPSVPSASVSRVVNPLRPSNPDASERMFSGNLEGTMRDLLEQIGGAAGGETTGPTGRTEQQPAGGGGGGDAGGGG